ncbi:MAG: hypothetical protein Ct9H300mP28_14080 [Pseudomonadota bacterium]|nr:MAG: hypothetical protein Ct9H300mP28_14080 [Pseudomonadota bacterium]
MIYPGKTDLHIYGSGENAKAGKNPGIAETLDWARSLVTLHQKYLDPKMVEATLGIVFKDKIDVTNVKDSLADFFEKVDVKFKETSCRIKSD